MNTTAIALCFLLATVQCVPRFQWSGNAYFKHLQTSQTDGCIGSCKAEYDTCFGSISTNDADAMDKEEEKCKGYEVICLKEKCRTRKSSY